MEMINISIRPKLIVLVGLPGSGKSAYAQKIESCCRNTVHISSDVFRERYFSDVNDQSHNAEVFEMMKETTLRCLNSGLDVIYDATNLIRKNRVNLLKDIPAFVQKDAVIVWAKLEDCLSRDMERDRKVGEDVIDKMIRNYTVPYYDEGFDQVSIVNTSEDESMLGYRRQLLESMQISQDNPHHTLSVYDHCKLCADNLSKKYVESYMREAAIFHDVGKPYTKCYNVKKNSQEVSEVARYFDHHNVGAYLITGLPYIDLKTVWLVNHHMDSYVNQKYLNSLPEFLRAELDALHESDMCSR